MKRNRGARYVAAGLVVIGAGMAIGCATKDTVSSRFPPLEANIHEARAAQADVYAPAPLKSAETKLAAAKAAVAAGDMISASRLADEATVDADYARAVAPTEKAKGEIVKLQADIKVLRDEIKKLPAAK